MAEDLADCNRQIASFFPLSAFRGKLELQAATDCLATDVANPIEFSTFDMMLQGYAHPVIGGNRHPTVIDRMADKVLSNDRITVDVTAARPAIVHESCA